MFSEPDMAMNWQNETTSHTDGERGEAVDPVACECARGMDKISAEDNETTRLAMAESATAAAVRVRDAKVIRGDCALTVFVRGMDAQRMVDPVASKSWMDARASIAGSEKSCLGNLVGKISGAKNVSWNENFPLKL